MTTKTTPNEAFIYDSQTWEDDCSRDAFVAFRRGATDEEATAIAIAGCVNQKHIDRVLDHYPELPHDKSVQILHVTARWANKTVSEEINRTVQEHLDYGWDRQEHNILFTPEIISTWPEGTMLNLVQELQTRKLPTSRVAMAIALTAVEQIADERCYKLTWAASNPNTQPCWCTLTNQHHYRQHVSGQLSALHPDFAEAHVIFTSRNFDKLEWDIIYLPLMSLGYADGSTHPDNHSIRHICHTAIIAEAKPGSDDLYLVFASPVPMPADCSMAQHHAEAYQRATGRNVTPIIIGSRFPEQTQAAIDEAGVRQVAFTMQTHTHD